MKFAYRSLILLMSVAFVYILSYSVDSRLGGYYLKPVVDGRASYSQSMGGIGIPLALQWHPKWGFRNVSNTDFLGHFYGPLIEIDRVIWHHTKYANENDINAWVEMVKKNHQIHPATQDQ